MIMKVYVSYTIGLVVKQSYLFSRRIPLCLQKNQILLSFNVSNYSRSSCFARTNLSLLECIQLK